MEQESKKMEQAVVHLKEELAGIRSGKAHPALLEGVMVEAYGVMARLRDIATITSPEATTLLVTPFDRQNSAAIGKAIQKALNLNPSVDSSSVRVSIPPMDKEMRLKRKKVVNEKREHAKVIIRGIRRDANEHAKTLPEDEKNRREKKTQEMTDRFCKQIDDLCNAKEKEIDQI